MRRPRRWGAGLQLDDAGLRVTPCGIARRDAGPHATRVASPVDGPLELPASIVQRGRTLGGGLRRVASLPTLALATFLLGLFTGR